MIDPRDVRIAELEAEGRIDKARIAELERQVAQLTALVMSLKQQLERSSRNSHLPPSSDGPGGRSSPEKPKVEGQRKRGGQLGHSGSKRELVPECVDKFIELYPKQCESCWAPLPQVRDSQATRYQVTEVPPIRPHTTEYRCNSVKCVCGYVTFSESTRIFLREVFRWQRKQARRQRLKPRVGAILFSQLFGRRLNLHFHHNALVPDGVFVEADGKVRLEKLPRPELADLETVLRRIANKTMEMVRRRGLLDLEPAEDDILAKMKVEAAQAGHGRQHNRRGSDLLTYGAKHRG